MSKSENEKIVNSAIDVVEPEQKQPETITIPKDQYQALMTANLNSHLNTLNTLDDIDRIIASMTNVQIFAMNIKEKIKKNQLGLNQNNNQNQPLTDKTNAQ